MTNEEATAASVSEAQNEEDIQTARLPFDVQIGATRFRKGVHLSTFISAARRWFELYAASQLPLDQGAAAGLKALMAGKELPEGTMGGIEMRERVPVPIGELVAVTYGRYSSYSVVSHVRTLREVDFDSELANYLERHPNERGNYELCADRFVAELIGAGAVEGIRAWEVHLDDGEDPSEADVTPPEEDEK